MKRVFLLFLVILMLLGFTACGSLQTFVSQNAGIHNLKFYNNGGKVCFKVEYFDCMGYSVEILKDDDVIIKGEQPVPFQDEIGENAIKISLYETKFEKLLNDYDTFTVYNVRLEGTNLKFMLFPSAEHSLYIYVGFADNIKPLATERTNLTIPFGSIQLELGDYK